MMESHFHESEHSQVFVPENANLDVWPFLANSGHVALYYKKKRKRVFIYLRVFDNIQKEKLNFVRILYETESSGIRILSSLPKMLCTAIGSNYVEIKFQVEISSFDFFSTYHVIACNSSKMALTQQERTNSTNLKMFPTLVSSLSCYLESNNSNFLCYLFTS